MQPGHKKRRSQGVRGPDSMARPAARHARAAALFRRRGRRPGFALRLLLLPEEVRSLVEDGTISAGHARAILSLPAARLQKAAAQKIVALRLSVRQAEAMCKRMLQEEEKPEPKPAPLTVDYVAECEKSLTRRLDRKVRIVNGKRKGRFELEFYGQEDLQRLYDALLALGKTEETPECLN